MEEKKTATTEIEKTIDLKRAKEMLYYLYDVTRCESGEEVTREAYEPTIEWLFGESHDREEREEKYRLICRYARPGRPLTLRILEGEIKPCHVRVEESFIALQKAIMSKD